MKEYQKNSLYLKILYQGNSLENFLLLLTRKNGGCWLNFLFISVPEAKIKCIFCNKADQFKTLAHFKCLLFADVLHSILKQAVTSKIEY